ncbi:DrmB family protein [Rhizobium sp. HT1-10]|uniref:DrmB family protein n=1 Tax=Rhizobium sp. HT1-10 TaxID=3111638 RepID=UPI003C1FA6A8
MTKNAQRLSQLISTFGPGAMIDLPTRSVVVGGLEQWDMKGNAFTTLAEPRLTMRLEQILKEQGRLNSAAHLSLRTPPMSANARDGIPNGVAAPVFPTWFICEQLETNSSVVSTTRRRRLVRWQDLDSKGRRRFQFDDGRKSDVTPIRFVCACDNGHLQDIDWRWVVHGSVACQEAMWVEEKGTSADPADTNVICGCGRHLSLQDTFQPGRLGKCRGERPWLLDRDPAGCGDNLKLLTRTATNTYFPQVHTVISLPSEEDELSQLVEDLSGDLVGVQTVEDVGQAKRFNPKVAASLGPFADDEIFARLVRIREGAKSDASRSPKLAEFDTFASGSPEIGTNHPTAKLYAQTLARAEWADPAAEIDISGIKNLVAVHRLREVSCLYGFTRFEAAPTSADGDIEDVQLSVRGAPISRDADWLPAIEQFGEGIFIHFDEIAIKDWLHADATAHRNRQLLVGYNHWQKRFTGKAPAYPGTSYVLLHSISHALMAEIALDCGYPASSLKERVYALSSKKGAGEIDRCGILIYTASTGAQGTLGGLVATAPRFASILKNALERLGICSNDPVCADHEPDDRSGDRATHGAACHGCLLIAETSCEMRNLFLDRSLLIPTMSGDQSCFFK